MDKEKDNKNTGTEIILLAIFAVIGIPFFIVLTLLFLNWIN